MSLDDWKKVFQYKALTYYSVFKEMNNICSVATLA